MPRRKRGDRLKGGVRKRPEKQRIVLESREKEENQNSFVPQRGSTLSLVKTGWCSCFPQKKTEIPWGKKTPLHAGGQMRAAWRNGTPCSEKVHDGTKSKKSHKE